MEQSIVLEVFSSNLVNLDDRVDVIIVEYGFANGSIAHRIFTANPVMPLQKCLLFSSAPVEGELRYSSWETVLQYMERRSGTALSRQVATMVVIERGIERYSISRLIGGGVVAVSGNTLLYFPDEKAYGKWRQA